MRALLADAKNSSIPTAVGMTGCEPEFVQLVNDAQQRLVMSHELWWEVTERYVVSVVDGCITWPRFVASVIVMAVNTVPMPVRNGWFEFLECGYGIRDPKPGFNDCGLFDRGTAPVFADISGPNLKVKLYADEAESAGQFVTIYGTDGDGHVLRSADGSEGLQLAIPINPGVPTISPVMVRSVRAVAKPITKGALRLYELDEEEETQRAMAIWEPEETRPAYRRSLLGGLCSTQAHTVTVMVKREFHPALRDSDWLMIANLQALRHMMLAVKQEDAEAWQQADLHERKAREILEREAAHYIGPGRIVPLRIDGETWNAGSIPQLY